MRRGHGLVGTAWMCTSLLYAVLTIAADHDAWKSPIKIGETLDQVMANLGERATFGADCGTWTGPAVDTTLSWGRDDLQVMGLLQGNRVASVRFEQTVPAINDVDACDASLADFADRWRRSGYVPGNSDAPLFDGPLQGTMREAFRHGERVGRFEAEYRASRRQCRVALIVFAED